MSRYLEDLVMPFGRPRRTTLADEGAYQVDLVVAFFSILLVLFVVYSAHAYSEITERSLVKYRTKDKNLIPFKLHSFSPIYPYRDFWVLKDNNLFKLNMTALARLYNKMNGHEKIWHSDGARIEMKILQDSPAEYITWIQIYNKMPISLTNISFQLKDKKNIIKAVQYIRNMYILHHHPPFFFIWKKQNSRTKVVILLSKLTSMGIPYSISFVDYEFAIRRKSESYGLENVLRPY